MLVHFHNVTIVVEAETPKAAYTVLQAKLEATEFYSDLYETEKDIDEGREPRSTADFVEN